MQGKYMNWILIKKVIPFLFLFFLGFVISRGRKGEDWMCWGLDISGKRVSEDKVMEKNFNGEMMVMR